MARFGTVELGGTKILVASGTTPDDLTAPHRIDTSDPESNLSAIVTHLSEASVDAVGIASFGPLELRPGHADFGNIVSTPKRGWSDAPVARRITDGIGVPVSIDTDVNAAALGEGRWGASAGLATHAYVTVGTGIGMGAVVRGRTISGLGHPEMGHFAVIPRPDDSFPGRCPFHATCLEGMASGPALADRFGPHQGWDEAVTGLAAHYVAQGLRSVVYAIAPERIVVGGGVSRLSGFHDLLRGELAEQLAGYPAISERTDRTFLTRPVFENSGLVGSLILARNALG